MFKSLKLWCGELGSNDRIFTEDGLIFYLLQGSLDKIFLFTLITQANYTFFVWEGCKKDAINIYINQLPSTLVL